MPLYEYHCEDCQSEFSELRKFSEMDQPISCPECGSSKTSREVSGFAVSGCSGGGGGRGRFR